MLTRFVRIQLTIFTIASIIGILAMIFFYMQVPTLLGIGKMTVTVELPAAGGLYRFSNVTYRGVEVGKVTSVALTGDGAKAVLRLNTSPKIPADLEADVRSISRWTCAPQQREQPRQQRISPSERRRVRKNLFGFAVTL